MSSLISLKLMAELPDEAAALRFQNEVQARIADFGGIRQSETKRYWKIPEWFVVNFRLEPNSAPALAFDSILLSLGEGWERHDICDEEQWAVWNPNEGNTFCSSEVRWAYVERFPESAIVSP